MDKLKHSHIAEYFILAFAISWVLWSASVINTRFSKVPDIFLFFSQLGVLGPMIAAMILQGKKYGKAGVGQMYKDAWNFNFNPIWLLPTLFLPAAMIAVTLLIKLPIEGASFHITKPPMPIPIFIVILFFAGGPLEEFGWRGYALPKMLHRFPFVPAALILGALHGLWHLPLHFMEGTVQSAIPVWEFIAVTAVGSIIYTWIYKNTDGNVTLMILHHWAGNISAALLVYWDTPLGRWIFFGVQFVVAVIIVISNVRKEKAKSTLS